MMPFSASVARKVVLTLLLSITASTATFDSTFCSSSGMPSLSNVARISGSTSSMLPSFLGGTGDA